ncbi:hypothetical protein DKX38_018827 [Salix brachista]|uniref:Uncharacterized protein n=1 Tax=Salix brachista TaxID=2182728 RepID=A0A5N5KP94_9ROSI|nr:hypothetical protein DKX38_018827 [Salix brachista]
MFQAQMHSLSSDVDRTVVIDPVITMSTRFLTARQCTSRESNPGLYRGRVLFYHQTTGASLFRTVGNSVHFAVDKCRNIKDMAVEFHNFTLLAASLMNSVSLHRHEKWIGEAYLLIHLVRISELQDPLKCILHCYISNTSDIS